MAMVDADGTVVASYTYSPYGEVLSETGAMADINPLRYRGYYYESSIGFYYLQSRYYDPYLGRFLNADSYASTGQGLLGYNMFAYCLNNPVMGIDPTGEFSFKTIFNGVELMTIGALAVSIGITIMTCGTAAPLMVAAAALTASAGTLTVMNGAAEVAEGITDYNPVRDGLFQGDSAAYNNHREATATISQVGTLALGAYGASRGGNICFIAGTLVLTQSGNVPIEKVKVGDYVFAWDEETDTVALKEVVETYINETDELIHVFVNGEEIVTTPSHPFYSPIKGWTDAVHLRAGDILVLVNGEYAVVEKVQHEILEAPVTVYNFQVEDYHTYYVTDIGVLVHNMCAKKRDLHQVDSAAREVGIPSEYRRLFGKFIEDSKVGYPKDYTYSYGELLELAKEFLEAIAK